MMKDACDVCGEISGRHPLPDPVYGLCVCTRCYVRRREGAGLEWWAWDGERVYDALTRLVYDRGSR